MKYNHKTNGIIIEPNPAEYELALDAMAESFALGHIGASDDHERFKRIAEVVMLNHEVFNKQLPTIKCDSSMSKYIFFGLGELSLSSEPAIAAPAVVALNDICEQMMTETSF